MAKASGVCAAILPIRAASMRHLVAPSTAHLPQSLRPALMLFPQARHARSGFGIATAGAGKPPLASRLCCCVSRVAVELRLPARDVVAQSVWAAYSAHGATSLPQTDMVSLSFAVSVLSRRQLPFGSSKKSDLRKGSRMIQSNSQASTEGRTAFHDVASEAVASRSVHMQHSHTGIKSNCR